MYTRGVLIEYWNNIYTFNQMSSTSLYINYGTRHCHTYVCWLCMFLHFWLFGRRSFSISLPFCLFIGRTFAGCASFCAFGCLVGAPLVFACLLACLLAARLPVEPGDKGRAWGQGWSLVTRAEPGDKGGAWGIIVTP